MRQTKAIREALGLTQEQCAAALNIPAQRWRRYENLKSDPSPEMRDAIADLLGVSLDQLAGRAPFQVPTPKAG